MTKVIIFDFWGTLVENGVRPSPSKQVQFFLRENRPFGEFIITFEEAFMTKKYDSLREGFEAVVQAFGRHIPDFVYDKLVGMWNKFSILSRPFEETVEALEDLKKDYKLVLLTNTDYFSVQQVMDKYDLRKHFDKVYLSCETGKLKSDPDSYKQVLKDLKVKAGDVLVVGDSLQSDVVSAQNAGVPVVLIDRRDWCKEEDMPKIANLRELRGFIAGK
jgi:putative hydrolase of the HAD superfamily